MADSSLLAQIISGTNPNAPLMLGGYQGSQLSNAALNPEFAKNEGPFGALAKTLAGMAGPGMLQRGVEATTAANNAARPDLAKLLASQDPYSDLAAPGAAFNPLAVAQILQGTTPGQVAETRKAAAEAVLGGMNVRGFQGMPPAGAGAAVPVGKNAGAALGASSSATPSLGTGRYPAPAEAADPVSGILTLPPAQQAAAIAKLTPAQRLALKAKIGGGGALRPPT